MDDGPGIHQARRERIAAGLDDTGKRAPDHGKGRLGQTQREDAGRQPLGANGDGDFKRAVLARQPRQRAGFGKGDVGIIAGIMPCGSGSSPTSSLTSLGASCSIVSPRSSGPSRASMKVFCQSPPALPNAGLVCASTTVLAIAGSVTSSCCTIMASLRKCVSAGETLPKGTYEAWLKATGIQIIDGIGATEMLHIFISAREEDIRPGATGKPVPGYEAKIVDDEGRDLPPGSMGRLAVRGPTGCRYLADERQTRFVQNGWNLTGDTYVMDADGYYWYQSRSDDMSHR